jgi:lon-related putative ATP-dependent protease
MIDTAALSEPAVEPPATPAVPASSRELKAAELRWFCDPARLPFESTSELEQLDGVLGQPRAVAAMEFGVAMAASGYCLYALGPPGIGKRFVVERFLERHALRQPRPEDWCYVYDFADPHRPHALRLPAGRATELRRDMEELVEDLRTALTAAFEREDYQSRRQQIDQEVEQRHEKNLEELGTRAQEQGLAIMRTPLGMLLAPVKNGEVLSPAEVEKLPEEERQRLGRHMDELRGEMEKVFLQIPRWRRERRDKVLALDREVSRAAAGVLLDELRKKYEALPDVVAYLSTVEEDVLDHAQMFRGQQEEAAVTGEVPDGEPGFRRYRVNVLVDRADLQAAPVIYEDHPTYANLLGRVEHVSQMGTLVTDFTLIKPGALHRANGGYLILDALELLSQPFAWDGLKRALRAQRIKIEPMAQAWLLSTVSLEPEPIPLAVKVVLVGDRLLYYLLSAFDPDFPELFKVQVDFEETLDRTEDNQLLYARLIAGLVKKEKLKPFDRTAVARVLEHSVRLAADTQKLSLRGGDLVDVLREADYWCQDGRTAVTAGDVQRAVDAQIFRADRVRQRLQEEIRRGTLLIDTEGSAVGQVNGLSVLQLGGFSFGHPGRITARVRVGEGEVMDIEREVKLSGPVHSKGVLILSGFLGERYAADQPLSLSASLVFEQSYAGVEGDSASLAELCALLSAISGLPVRQSLAVTGSVNQHGCVQAVGGVNEKIEGFFDVCAARGLTGRQGVLIPAANVQHLMLRQDVVDAVREEKFHLYPVTLVDEAVETLTGMPAGRRDESGFYPIATVNRLVADRLTYLAEIRRDFLYGGQQGLEE